MSGQATHDDEELADRLYTTYCRAVGGVAFGGGPLPSWQTFRATEGKRTQSDAWVAVATIARVLVTADNKPDNLREVEP